MGSLIKLVASYAFAAYKNLLGLERVMRAPHRVLLRGLLKDQTQFAKRLGKLSPRERREFSQKMTEHLRTATSNEANEHLTELGNEFINERQKPRTPADQEIIKVMNPTNRGVNGVTTGSSGSGWVNILPPIKGPPKSSSPLGLPFRPIGSGVRDHVPRKPEKGGEYPVEVTPKTPPPPGGGGGGHTPPPRPKEPPGPGRPINEYGDFALLSSSGLSAGVFFQQTLEQGFLELSILKTGKHYLYPNVSLRTWDAMKAARGKNGSGAGSVFGTLYLRPLHFGFVKGKYLSQYRQIKKDLGIQAKSTLENIMANGAAQIVNMYKPH